MKYHFTMFYYQKSYMQLLSSFICLCLQLRGIVFLFQVSYEITRLEFSITMASRTMKILELAKKKFIENRHLEPSCSTDTSHDIILNISADSFLLNEALTPENITEIVNAAELVFSNDDASFNEQNQLATSPHHKELSNNDHKTLKGALDVDEEIREIDFI